MTGIPERDGLQPERTALAWQRTALVSTLSATAVMGLAVRVGDWASALLSGVVTIIGVVLTDLVLGRNEGLRHDDVVDAQWRPLVMVGACVLLTAVAATLVAVRMALG